MSPSSESGPVLSVVDLSHDALRGVSFEVAPGEAVRIMLPSGDHVRDLYAVLTGAALPAGGRVRLFGADLHADGEAGRLRLFQRVGAVPNRGGLISNLKVWENLVLPAWFHRGLDAQALEPVVLEWFAALGVTGPEAAALMPRLPDALAPAQRRAVALVRAMVAAPDLLIYEDMLSGLDRSAASRWIGTTAVFHRRHASRSSLYLCPDEAVSERIEADRVVRFD
jgi:phospholipid/cholesterol/gamma-HCH transport system ATP-binding protein